MNYKNLAGDDVERNDRQIAIELKRCGIDVVPWDRGTSEVRTNNCGIYRKTKHRATFHRAWTYWVVDCRLPVETATRMYRHPVGFSDIRVGGHCGCPAPTGKYVEWRDPATDKQYATTSDKTKIEDFRANHPEMVTKFLEDYLFHDDPVSVGAIGTVDSYHIDTELGLYVFMRFLEGTL